MKSVLYPLLVGFLAVLSPVSLAQDPQKIGVEELKEILNDQKDQLYIINFWATWCSPCVTELPYFQEAHKKFSSQNMEIILVSLDFPSQVESRLIPFLKEKSIEPRVLIMNELDYDRWISLVDKNWKGALPATLIYNNVTGKREFVPGAVEKEELFQLIRENLN